MPAIITPSAPNATAAASVPGPHGKPTPVAAGAGAVGPADARAVAGADGEADAAAGAGSDGVVVRAGTLGSAHARASDTAVRPAIARKSPRTPSGASAAGTLLFVGMMALGYYYNVTFVQIGLTDLGRTPLGPGARRGRTVMAVLALVTSLVASSSGCGSAAAAGAATSCCCCGSRAGVVVVQTVLTALTPLVATPAAYLAWVVVCSLALGVGVPVDLRAHGRTSCRCGGAARRPRASPRSRTWRPPSGPATGPSSTSRASCCG
jgi:hypothetical protein